MTRVWVVRAGTKGSLIDLTQRESVVCIGWGELGDLGSHRGSGNVACGHPQRVPGGLPSEPVEACLADPGVSL
jgi:alpha-tubulin suppressor-like RCC1 family protein